MHTNGDPPPPTTQSLFLKFGYKKNLTFAIPRVLNYLGNPEHFMVSHPTAYRGTLT